MTMLLLSQAMDIIDAALAEARKRQCKPLAVVVLDVGGNPVAFKREDHCGLLRHGIAHSKAWGALGMGVGSRTLMARCKFAPEFFAAAVAASNGRLIPVPGGVLIRDDKDFLVGAVGVSGDLPDADEACAVAGILQAGLKPDPGNDAAH
ncbi:GlcG/HbpS family heme-binding protein [Achromobacter pestifer]